MAEPAFNDAEPIFDVAIIGLGPCGAIAAALLGGQGLTVLVCDQSTEVYDKPRAFALDHEIMRVFQQMGIAERVLEFAEPFTPSEFLGVDGQLIKRFTTVQPPYPLAFEPSLVFNQPQVERLIRQAVGALPTVQVVLGQTLLAIEQDPHGVTITIAPSPRADAAGENLAPDGAQPRIARARYLIGCDGANSTVRRLSGIALDDLGFDQPWLVVDALVNASGLAKLPKVSQQICEPQRPMSFLIGPKNHRRWEIAINDGEDPQLLATPAQTWKLLSRWLTPADALLWRQASYRFHALVASRWRSGRVFLAGDAAHQQPPFLGQGMCQGVRDVANLSWKLEAVLRHDADAHLLDSYGLERKAHVIELSSRIKGIGELVGERDPAAARARDARLLKECGGTVVSQPRQSVQPALAQGLLSAQPDPARGTLFPQPWIRVGAHRQRLDELTGRGWRVVIDAAVNRRDDWLRLVTAPLTAVAVGDGALAECDQVLAGWFRQHQCAAAIVRPDHYVYGVAADRDVLSAELAQLRAQLAYRESD